MKIRDTVTAAVNVLAIGVIGYFLLGPTGPILRAVQRHRAEKKLSQHVQFDWERLTGLGGRLDAGPGEVALIEFSDYQCPFCQRTHRALSRFLAKHPQIGVVHRHLPLPMHAAAEGAARASICAERQNQFLDMHRHLFENDRWHEDPDWVREAASAGIRDTAAFRSCLPDSETTARLEEDLALAGDFGIDVTPTWVYRDGIHSGALSVTQLEKLVGIAH